MRRFLIPVFLLAAISWAVFAYIILVIPPEIGGALVRINLIYFFVSGWIAVASTVSLLLYFINFLFEEIPKKRLKLEEDLRPRRVFRTSARRGAIFATTIASLGLLKIYELDNLPNSVFIVLIALLIEVYFSSR